MPENTNNYTVNIEIKYPLTKELAKIIEGSLIPEIETPISNRSHTQVHTDNSNLYLKIGASDLSAMRAAVNSYLRWVEAILDIVGKLH
jgi:tRNA threonylcarbamoyladenosine modification (KEOPS) complex  Pcc1 subunit